MQNLNRDYEIVCVKYQKLVQRREQASMSEKVDTEGMSIKLKIVGPLKKPSSPFAPKRLLFSSNVLLMDLCTGLSLAYLAFYISFTHTFSLNYYGYGH